MVVRVRVPLAALVDEKEVAHFEQPLFRQQVPRAGLEPAQPFLVKGF